MIMFPHVSKHLISSLSLVLFHDTCFNLRACARTHTQTHKQTNACSLARASTLLLVMVMMVVTFMETIFVAHHEKVFGKKS